MQWVTPRVTPASSVSCCCGTGILLSYICLSHGKYCMIYPWLDVGWAVFKNVTTTNYRSESEQLMTLAELLLSSDQSADTYNNSSLWLKISSAFQGQPLQPQLISLSLMKPGTLKLICSLLISKVLLFTSVFLWCGTLSLWNLSTNGQWYCFLPVMKH